MITQDNFCNLLQSIGFELEESAIGIVYSKTFSKSDSTMSVDFTNKRLIYPEGITAERETTKNFHQPENFVVFECVSGLLEKGYFPEQIILEKGMPGGHGDTGGYCDIIVKDNNEDEYLLIECKTTEQAENDEFSKAWKLMLQNGGQLFNYYNSYRKAQYICLYASDWIDGKCKRTYHVISMLDNKEYLLSNKNLVSFETVTKRGGNRDEYYQVWKDTYQFDYNTKGIFEEEITPFNIGKKTFTIEDLQTVDATAIQKKYNQFATIMRQYNVSGRENAFDKLVNLFLVKIVDETRHGKELQFMWKGAAYDDFYNFQDRLQKMYQIGMKDYLNEEVTYIDNATIEETFNIQKNDPDAIKEKILEYFRQLKFFSNNDFAFLDVHNEQLFNQNAIILKEVVKMLQDIRLKTEEQNQFLGDLFEGFLDQGVKQSEGQFFTPTPIVRFLISSLPLENIIKESTNIPKVIDYACGAGHFLNEYAQQIKPFVEKYKGDNITEYYKEIYGIEKEYRLSKVAKVSSFMYGQEGINIIYADALSDKAGVKDGSYSVLVANPPYSVKGFLETLNAEEKEKYELTAEVSDLTKNNSIETFFIERAKQLLCPGGVAAIILPSSVLSNGNIYIKCREIILKYFDIVSIVEMGSGTFGKTGTNTVTLFLRRKSENPALATHYKYRVDAWFNGNTMHDERYADLELLERYCERIGVRTEDYKTLFVSSPNDELLKTDIFKEYIGKFSNDTRAKRIKTKRITAKYTEEMRNLELQSYIINSIKECEKDKLYFFLLALSNPQPVIIVKSPSKTTDIKKFLGYEWSSSKGNEGIKYIGANEVDEDNELERNKGISQIKTPLFDPSNLHNEEKINMLIRHNFLGEELCIADNYEEYVSVNNLVDLMDFSRTEFDKVIKTVIDKATSIQSKYNQTKLGDLVNIIRGVVYNKDEQTIERTNNVILTADNITLDCRLNISKEVFLYNYKFLEEEKKLKKDDCFMCFSSGSKTHVGKIAFIPSNTNYYAGGFMGILRVKVENLLPKYLYLILSSKSMQDILSEESKGTNIRNLTNTIALVNIPLPPVDIQKEIIDEFNKIDEEYESSISKIDECKKHIVNLFEHIVDIAKHFESLKNICTVNPSKSVLKDIDDKTLVSFVEMASVSNKGYISKMEDKTLGSLRSGSYTYFAENDIIIAKITPCMENGKCAIAQNLTNGIGLGSSEFHVFRCSEKIDNRFLFGFLNRSSIREEAEKQMTGSSGHRRVPIEFYEKLEIPLLTMEQQLEIVSQIEDYQLEINKAQAIIDSFNERKNSILNKYLR